MSRKQQPSPPFPEQNMSPPGVEARMEPRPRYESPHYQGPDNVKDEVVLITGGDSGIGRAAAVLFAREGADVALVHLPQEEEDARETANAVESEGCAR